MKNIFISVLLVLTWLLSASDSQAQSLILKRADTDSSRSGFITSGNLFSFDVVAENLDSCYNVEFLIKYDHADMVVYSGYKAHEFGKSSAFNVFNMVKSDTGTIYGVAFLSNFDEAPFNSPNLMNIDFVPYIDVIDNLTINFRITKISAVIKKNDTIKTVTISDTSFSYNTHGMIQVLPGDANNDKIVDMDDLFRVKVMVDSTMKNPAFKTFKRAYASTLWIPQYCLAWEIKDATYADCDGNGIINYKDQLVVHYYLKKKKKIVESSSENQSGALTSAILTSAGSLQENCKSSSCQKIPVSFASNYPCVATVFRIAIDDDLISNFIGVNSGSAFAGSDESLYYYIDSLNKELVIISGTYDHTAGSKSGVAAYVVINSQYGSISQSKPEIIEMAGITATGQIVDLYTITDVPEPKNDNSQELSANYSDGKVIITNKSNEYIDGSITIYNILGQVADVFDQLSIPATTSVSLPLHSRLSGLYLIQIHQKNKNSVIRFSIVE